jgi:hypothetical protein
MQANQEESSDRFFELSITQEQSEATYCSLDERKNIRYHAGDLCPLCNIARLEYDGLLNLVCPKCGTVSVGGFT